MTFKAQAGKIVGRSKEQVWGQIFQSKKLFLVLEISVSQDQQAAPLGKEIIETLSLEFDKLPKINLQNLKNLINLTSGRTSSLLKSREAKAEINIILCALADGVFYLVISGQGKAFLKREEKIATLLDGQGSGSGVLQDNDVLILSSPKFNQLVPFKILKLSLDQYSPEQIAENLAPLVESKEDSFGAAGLILKFEKQKEIQTEEKQVLAKKEEIPPSFFKNKIIALKNRLSKFRPSFVLKRRLSKEERTKKTVLTVALILIGLLVLSIIFGFGKKKRTFEQEKFQTTMETAVHQFEEGKALISLNTQKSRELLSSAKQLLAEVKDDFRKGSREKRETERLLEKINQALKEAKRAYKLEQVPLFFDPVLLKDKAFGQDLGLYKESLVILDRRQNTVYYLSLKDKKGKILAGGQDLAGAVLAGIHGDKVYVLADGGVIETELRAQSSELSIKKDDDWGEIADLTAYRGNIYLLDKKGKIWKYLRTDQGFAKRNYLAAGTEVDFSSANSMAIDGEIWVAKAEEILRFSLGAKKEFNIQGLEEELGSDLLLYTDEECENIYILDRKGKRVVILNKKGQYQAQYQWEELGRAEDLVVSEKKGKILVLVNGKIYEIEIK